MMLFRVSEAESFRQYLMDPDADDEALAALLARLRGETPPSHAMRAGTAFHKALESATPGEVMALEADGFVFTFVGDFDLALPDIREVRAAKSYQTEHGPITITGQLDAIHGKRVEDHKTTSYFDADRYLDGYQWRFYLDIFGADVFRWNVFEIKPMDDGGDEPMAWDVKAAHRLEQYRYPGLSSDCEQLADELARFARVHLPERVRA